MEFSEPMRLRNRRRGFSILELMIVLSIMAVLSAIAFPYWGEILKSYRQSTATSVLISDLRFARFEAVKNNTQVRVRFIDTSRYIIEKESGGAWQAVRPITDFSERYWTRGVTVSTGSEPVLFYPSGRVENTETYSVSCDDLETKQVVVSLSGMVRQG